jgi:hypothetical protein
MNLQHRIDLLVQLGEYILSNEADWEAAKEKASYENGWFIPTFVEQATQAITKKLLAKNALEQWVSSYEIPAVTTNPKTVGIVMAGNIPLVGFHDLLAVFIAGHRAKVKASSKDKVLLKQLVAKLAEWDKAIDQQIVFADLLKNCDAYIATGSNNTAGYFDYYFGKFPNIIRRTKTSVAVLSGRETPEELQLLADDVFVYFGLGCRNVTKIYVPAGYDFIPLLKAFGKYEYLADHHKYKNNYDYNLAIHILNKKFYMSTPAIILAEEESIFSPISQLNYGFYESESGVLKFLKEKTELQCIVGDHEGLIPFGKSQSPGLTDYADGIDTMAFVSRL